MWAAAKQGRWGAICIMAALSGAVARAEVIEISPTGAITRQAGPGLTTADGFVALSLPTKARAAVSKFSADYARAGAQAALSPELIEAVAYVESRHDPEALSPKGARGLMQLMPATAAGLGVDPRDPGENARGGAAYLRALLNQYRGDLVLTLAAYNAGPGAVARHKGVPPFRETQAYIAAVLDRLAQNQVQQDSPP